MIKPVFKATCLINSIRKIHFFKNKQITIKVQCVQFKVGNDGDAYLG